MFKKNANFFTCLILYGAAFVFSLIFLLLLADKTTVDTLDVDETYYYQEAYQLAHGQYIINTYRPPGFTPILAAALYFAQGDLFTTKLFLMLISSLRAPLIYLLIQKIIGNYKVALLTGLIVAGWPTIVYYSTTLYTENVSLSFFLAFLYLLPLGNVKSRAFRWVLAGLFFGMTILIHPMYLLFTPFALLIVILEEKQIFEALKHFIFLICGSIIIIAPWSITASIHEKAFYLLGTNSVDAIAGTFNENLVNSQFRIITAPNGRRTINGPAMWTPENGYLTPEEEELPAKERDALLFNRMIEWMKSHPYDVLYLEAVKIANLWGFYPIFWEIKSRALFGNIPMIIVFLLSITAMWKWRKYYRELCRLWTIPLFMTFVALITYGSWRYRLPADVALISLSMMLLIPSNLKIALRTQQ